MDVYLKNTHLPIDMLAETYVSNAKYLLTFFAIDLYYIYMCVCLLLYTHGPYCLLYLE